jgi:hypothetical protein
MAEFLLVVEGLMADGSDAAMMVDETTYKVAMFGLSFAEAVHGYVWCNRHGWVLADEACVCGDCVQEAMEAQIADDWWDGGDAGEFSYRRINRADPNYEPVYSREQAARQDVFDMAKGKMPRAFR